MTHIDDIHQSLKPSKILLAVGNEANGIPEDQLVKFDRVVTLLSPKPQSFNVAMSLGIALYKIFYG